MAIAEDMKLSQFDLVDCPAGNITDVVYKAGAPNNQIAIDEYNYKNIQQRERKLLQQQKQQYYNLQQQQQPRHQDPSKNTKIVATTYSGAHTADKNQHIRGVGIQLDKVAFSGGKMGQGVQMEVSPACKFAFEFILNRKERKKNFCWEKKLVFSILNYYYYYLLLKNYYY